MPGNPPAKPARLAKGFEAADPPPPNAAAAAAAWAAAVAAAALAVGAGARALEAAIIDCRAAACTGSRPEMQRVKPLNCPPQSM